MYIKNKSLASIKVQEQECALIDNAAFDEYDVLWRRNSAFIVLPGDTFKVFWDIFVTLLILFVCVTAPWRLAFTDEDDLAWMIVGGIVDLFFLADLVINFFTAYHDDEFNFVDDRTVTRTTRLPPF